MTAAGQRNTLAMRLWAHPSAVLLVVQLLGVLVYPFMDESPVGRAALSLVVLVLAVRTVRATPALSWVSVLLGVPIVLLTIVEAVDPSNAPVVFWSSALHAAFYAYTSLALIRYMFLDRFITGRRALGDRRDIHRRRLGLCLRLRRGPGRLAWVIYGRRGAGRAADLVRAAVPLLHEPDERRPV